MKYHVTNDFRSELNSRERAFRDKIRDGTFRDKKDNTEFLLSWIFTESQKRPETRSRWAR